MMGEESVVSNSYVFRGMEYIVSMAIDQQQGALTVEVEDRLSSDQWRGTFDAAYIEDLTHKTGNFKQFSIFVNMLESAVMKKSESVTLDLLTYADLESLRNRKAGSGTRSIPGAQKAALSTKRYLIVTYTVEFDRIHYPLPLPYQGKPDPVALQETVRELKAEIRRLKAQFHSNFKSVELQKLKKDYEDLLQEKQNLEDAFLNFRREVKNTTKGSAVKEIRVLKTVVRNLEEEMMNEKRKYQRSASKRNQEYKALLEEVEELRASDRNLRVRVKSLTNELAVLRRNPSSRRSSRSPSIPLSSQRSSAPRRSLSTQERSRIASRDRSLSRERPWSRERHRSSSRERMNSGLRNRIGFGSRDRIGSAGKDRRQRPSLSPSPAGARRPRFNPSTYIEDKKRRQEEARLKRERGRRRTLSSGSQPGSQERGRSRTRPSPSYQGYGRSHSRTSSVGSVGSRRSSGGGVSDVDVLSDSSQARKRRLKQVLKPGRTSSSTAWDSPNVPYRGKGSSGKGRRMMSTPDPAMSPARARRVVGSGKVRHKELNEYGITDDADYHNRSAEMSEIDARLNALQQFMKSNMH